MEGWIKLHRKLQKSQVFQNEGLLKVWIWCLMRANHRETWVPVKTGRGTTEVKLMPGQFIYGRKSAAEELKMKPSTVNDRMRKLKMLQNIDTQADTHYSIITVINWDIYQDKEKVSDTQADTHPTPIRHRQECKEGKEYIYAQFELFYRAYPRKQGKQAALKAWMKNPELSNGLFDTVMSSLEKQKATWKDKTFIPYPSTWINGRRWEDELPGSESKKNGWL